MMKAKFRWTEVIPPGSIQSSTQSYGAYFGSLVLSIKINWLDLTEAIKYIVGYSTCLGAAGAPFDPGNATNQGPWRLSRQLPARHPVRPNLRATKIVSVQGRGLRTTVGGPSGGRVQSGLGYYGNWQDAQIDILFEIPKYPMLDDDELAVVLRGAVQQNRRPEYLRFCEWSYDPNVETLARKGETWSFCLPAAFAQQQTFIGDRLLRQAKGTLKIKWYDVHQDYVMLGRLLPSNYHKRIATVNARGFPQDSYRDQNHATNRVRFAPGTCLLLAPKITPHAQCHPAVMTNQINADYFPRTVDVETTMIVFDPATNDTTTVDLSAAGYGPNPPSEGTQYTFNNLGVHQTLVRGHNLAPLEKPLNGFRFFAARNNGSRRITGATNANPIVITSANHGLATGAVVTISGVTGNTNANGTYTITVINANTFSLNGRNGNAAYGAGGTWVTSGGVTSDANLLHSYSNFEQLWGPPESL